MINNILLLDTETTGFTPKDSKLLEIGCIFYNIPSNAILHEICTLIPSDDNKAENINHINVDSLKNTEEVLSNMCIIPIAALMARADAVIAHYSKFDRLWIESHKDLKDISSDKLWICTKEHINWRKGPGLKLQDIAKHLEVPYEGAHRAMADCHILLNCLKKLPDLQEQLNFYCKAKKD